MYYLLTDKSFRKVNLKDITFKSLSKSEVLTIVEQSRCVIDINHPKQSGLTIRTIETLGAKRKLITTNKDIINYDFFDSNNVLVIDRDKPLYNGIFFDTPFKEIDDRIYNRYTLSYWVTYLFETEK